MAHMDPARWIREHLKTIVLGPRGVLGDREGFVVLPVALPPFFDVMKIVPFFQQILLRDYREIQARSKQVYTLRSSLFANVLVVF
jgi:hypothetical protein